MYTEGIFVFSFKNFRYSYFWRIPTYVRIYPAAYTNMMPYVSDLLSTIRRESWLRKKVLKSSRDKKRGKYRIAGGGVGESTLWPRIWGTTTNRKERERKGEDNDS